MAALQVSSTHHIKPAWLHMSGHGGSHMLQRDLCSSVGVKGMDELDDDCSFGAPTAV